MILIIRELICKIKGHQFVYWSTDKNKSTERAFRKCQRCGLTQEEVWTGFSEVHWCPVGYIAQDVIDAQFFNALKERR